MVEVEKKISSVEPSKLGIKKAYTPPSLLEYGNIAKLTPPTDLYWGLGSSVWNNTGDTATLKRPDGSVISWLTGP
jgi:hypothetical protein